MLLCCRSAVAPLSHRYRSAVAPLLSPLLSLRSRSCYRLRCCSTVAPLSLRYRSTVAPLSLCCRFCRSVSAAVDPAVDTLPLILSLLLSLHCHSCCRSAVAPLLSLCCRYAVAPLSFRYQSAVAPLFLRCRCCHSCCHSFYRFFCHSTAVAWIVHGRRLKRQNQGNCFHW